MFYNDLASVAAEGHNSIMVLKAKTASGPAREADVVRNPLESFLGYQLRRASQEVMAQLAASLADLDLTVVEMSVLVVINANPGIIQSDISRLLAIQRANMVPLTTRLEACGLIHKGVAVGRARGLHLTQAGALLVKECDARIVETEARVMSALTEAQRKTMMRHLRTVWE